MFRRAGIYGELTRDLKTIRWIKLMGNNGTNCVCALGRCSLARALKDPEGYRLMHELMLETVKVGQAEGAKLTDEMADNALKRLRAIANADEIRPSTLQDVERGKPLEYDAIAGAVIRAADHHGIAVPATRTAHALLKLLDKARD
jgi:2-dehydropantoate 2-reductase